MCGLMRIFALEVMELSFHKDSYAITVVDGSMASTDVVKKVEIDTGIVKIPDMFFSGSSLTVSWGSCSVSVESIPALRGCLIDAFDKDSENAKSLLGLHLRRKVLGKLEVRHASVWSAGAAVHSLEKLLNNHDWTYTTTYWGSVSPCNCENSSSGMECREDFLPWDLLKSTSEPVLFFKEVHLWEDELSDNGFSRMSAKVRVMNSFFYVLIKFEMRLDGVVDSRSLETRIFHRFGSNEVLREFRWIENGTEITAHRSQQTVHVK